MGSVHGGRRNPARPLWATPNRRPSGPGRGVVGRSARQTTLDSGVVFSPFGAANSTSFLGPSVVDRPDVVPGNAGNTSRCDPLDKRPVSAHDTYVVYDAYTRSELSYGRQLAAGVREGRRTCRRPAGKSRLTCADRGVRVPLFANCVVLL